MKKHVSEEIVFLPDPHTAVSDPDFTPLDKLYAGRKAYYGDYHCHSKSGGNSDGHTTPKERG